MTPEEIVKKAAEWLYLNLDMSEEDKKFWVDDFVEYMNN